MFEGLFKNSADNVNSYLTNPSFVEVCLFVLITLTDPNFFLQSLKKQSPGTRLDILQNIRSCLNDKPLNFAQCVIWARLKFEELYTNNIQQLLYNFPKDMITTTGSTLLFQLFYIPFPITLLILC
jgi:ubiquitin-activating enzyme E1